MKSEQKKSNSNQSRIDKNLVRTLNKFIRPHARNSYDTDDILQNVLMKILKNGDSIPAAGFLSWLQKVSYTTCIDFYRKNKFSIQKNHLDKIETQMVDDPSLSTLESLSKCVRPLLKNLSTKDFQIISAVDLEGVSQKVFAEKNGVNYSALKSKLQRARLKLKNEILDCCQIELDRRNSPMDVKAKNGDDCCS